jgi:hypothetical protein
LKTVGFTPFRPKTTPVSMSKTVYYSSDSNIDSNMEVRSRPRPKKGK